MLELKGIQTGEIDEAAIDKIDEYLLFFSKPSIFSGKNSVEVRYEKQFDELCILISKKTGFKAKDLTVLSFYNTLEHLKKESKPKPTSKRKNGR